MLFSFIQFCKKSRIRPFRCLSGRHCLIFWSIRESKLLVFLSTAAYKSCFPRLEEKLWSQTSIYKILNWNQNGKSIYLILHCQFQVHGRCLLLLVLGCLDLWPIFLRKIFNHLRIFVSNEANFLDEYICHKIKPYTKICKSMHKYITRCKNMSECASIDM